VGHVRRHADNETLVSPGLRGRGTQLSSVTPVSDSSHAAESDAAPSAADLDQIERDLAEIEVALSRLDDGDDS
jgi:hypothetical protein